MYYAIYAEDVANSVPLRAQARDAHIARLKEMEAAGRLMLAGPFPNADTDIPGDAGFSGSLIVAQFDSLAAAQAWAEADPYKAAGVYQSVTVKPFKPVLPANMTA
ncbi:YciI family protein [Thiomicrospira sp. WB1]|uniref:YciI family protein n=1 Tax=Thiomicrospira sp. WB1 TaxID=1685380 RepID=UPI00074643BB|nr:YciI family protein [Thiomicrospira sp. WB1]KUJ72057.1 BolA family transcriptional regulator [Thiomicrospira sp. WB1]